MADNLERLRQRVDVYAKVEGKTDFGELTYNYEKIKTVWAEVLATGGTEENIWGTYASEEAGSATRSTVTHKITVRKNAITNPRVDMYFMFRGQKYKVRYFLPQFRKDDLIEFYCELRIEGEHDYEQYESNT